jgi:hypothetical protein
MFDHRLGALGPGRYSKDWTISGRYDFNQYLYAKAEQHVIDGTAELSTTIRQRRNTGRTQSGSTPQTKLTILKIGVSF